MQWILIIGISLIIILFIIFIILLIKKIKQEQKYKEEYIEQKKQKFDQDLANEAKALETAIENRRITQENFEAWRQQELKHIQEREEVAKKYVDSLEEQKQARLIAEKEAEAHGKANIEALLEQYYGSEMTEYTRSLRAVENDLRETIEEDFYNTCASLNSDIASLRAELDEYRKKRDAINAEILRQRALEEKQDFYRICLSQLDIDDIQILNSIRSRLHKHDGLDKLIYDFYVSKQVQEMTKRVLEGGTPSGIYKITRLKTGEIYIGKSTDIKARWQQHAKTVFGCGTIAHSILHTTMEKDGIENFTFELLEEVPKDKLTEREKYWISFYDSKKYGLNEREG